MTTVDAAINSDPRKPSRESDTGRRSGPRSAPMAITKTSERASTRLCGVVPDSYANFDKVVTEPNKAGVKIAASVPSQYARARPGTDTVTGAVRIGSGGFFVKSR